MIIQASLAPRLPTTRSGSQSHRPRRAAARMWTRNDWLAACRVRLSELRPDQSAPVIESMALALWLDVAAFDPVIAAEMEYETWRAGAPPGEPSAGVRVL